MNLLRRINSRTPARASAVELMETWQDTRGLKTFVNLNEYATEGLAIPTIAALIKIRASVLSEARFFWRDRQSKEPILRPRAEEALDLLRNPWPNGTTGDLISAMEMDVSLAGNAFILKTKGENGVPMLQRLRPDWVSLVMENRRRWCLGYLYQPDGDRGREVFLPLNEVAHHFDPGLPDPMRPYLGRSWISSVLWDANADIAATKYQASFYSNAATPNMVVKVQRGLSEEQRELIKEQISRRYEGAENAWKTLILEGGADVTVVGRDLKEVEYSATRAGNESRIAAVAGVPPVLVGFREGLQAATYSNYNQAVRRFVDGTLRPLWRQMSAKLQTIVTPPTVGAELWYDESSVGMLQQDMVDAAEILQKKASTMETLIRAGYDQDYVAAAVEAGNLKDLPHTGLFSVQLQPPGTPMASLPEETTI